MQESTGMEEMKEMNIIFTHIHQIEIVLQNDSFERKKYADY